MMTWKDRPALMSEHCMHKLADRLAINGLVYLILIHLIFACSLNSKQGALVLEGVDESHTD